jgi:lipoate-protein ligase A
MQAKAEPDGIYANANMEIATAQAAWLFDVLLLQGTVYANTEMEKPNSAFKRDFTSLSTELKRSVQANQILDIVLQGFEKKLNLTCEKKGLTDAEQRLV